MEKIINNYNKIILLLLEEEDNNWYNPLLDRN
jgi:hypothetical protein